MILSYFEYKERNYPFYSNDFVIPKYNMYYEGEQEIEMKMNSKKSWPCPVATDVLLCTSECTPTPCSDYPDFRDGGCEKQEVDTVNRQEGKTQMNTNSERDYTKSRLYGVSNDKTCALRIQFKVDEYLGPRTYKDLIDWVTNGKYTLDTKQTNIVDSQSVEYSWFADPMSGIVWNGKGVADHKGYGAAMAAKKIAYQSAMDIIMTSDAAAGLAALQAFEAWGPTPAVSITNASAQ